LLLAGACLGSLTKGSEQTFGAAGYTYTVIAVCKSYINIIANNLPRIYVSNALFLSLVVNFSSFVQNCGLEIVFLGKITILEGE